MPPSVSVVLTLRLMLNLHDLAGDTSLETTELPRYTDSPLGPCLTSQIETAVDSQVIDIETLNAKGAVSSRN